MLEDISFLFSLRLSFCFPWISTKSKWQWHHLKRFSSRHLLFMVHNFSENCRGYFWTTQPLFRPYSIYSVSWIFPSFWGLLRIIKKKKKKKSRDEEKKWRKFIEDRNMKWMKYRNKWEKDIWGYSVANTKVDNSSLKDVNTVATSQCTWTNRGKTTKLVTKSVMKLRQGGRIKLIRDSIHLSSAKVCGVCY